MICDAYHLSDGKLYDMPRGPKTADQVLEHMTLKPTSIWIYMVRKEYLCECEIVQNYYTETKGSHEPAFQMPLYAFG